MVAVPPAAPLPPPATPAEAALVRLIGAEAALRLVEQYGGLTLDVPRSVNQGSALPRKIGLGAARILVEKYSGGRMQVPLARAWRARIYRERDGLSIPDIARRLSATRWTVMRWLNDTGCGQAAFDTRDHAQLNLFD